MDLENLRIDPAKFALSCVQSSSTQLSVDDKMKVYKEAYGKAYAIYNKIQSKLDKQEQENRQRRIDAMNSYLNEHGLP